MNGKPMLADSSNPLVQQTATRLTAGESSASGKLKRLFYFVRDEIKFGFPKEGDMVKASETIQSAVGQCNTKGTLFLALCKALDIPARLHFATIPKQIQRGLFTGLAFKLMPPFISHSWLEVNVDDQWRRIDSYINDLPFYNAAKSELLSKGWKVGFSIALSENHFGIDFNLDESSFVQMTAVTGDHGVWDEPVDYYRTSNYSNRPGRIRLLAYRFLIGSINRRIQIMRDSSPQPESCG